MDSSNSILDTIFAYKRQEIEQRKSILNLEELRRIAEAQPPQRDFLAALCHSKPALIAEVKRASPSKGDFGSIYSPLELAQLYMANGAAAISVLTDEKYFRGSLDDLRAIANLGSQLPILQKDFICDPYQIYEARASGADAILLIASYLELDLIQDLHDLARELGMHALVETHTAEEIEKALRIRGLKIIGVNNRNLRDFSVNIQTCLQLRPLVPPQIQFVAESGIHTAAQVRLLIANKINALLVGEALVKAQNPAEKLCELLLKTYEDQDLRHQIH
ncbi:MAG: Indole-3-glycerol phosphate synthase [Anaerolineae bacterium]|jgi:indole-3-glycerol phosphate synthase|nr:MAG: Indole-3-glycerol phosphate synthase [Anaerolineae bacterium]